MRACARLALAGFLATACTSPDSLNEYPSGENERASQRVGVPGLSTEGLVVLKRDGRPSKESLPHAGALLSRTAAGEKIRVVAGLALEFEPEGGLSSAEAVTAQRAEIALMNSLLAAELQERGVVDLRKLTPLPFISMRAGEKALAYLIEDPNVVSIEEDRFYDLLLQDSIALIGADEIISVGADGSGKAVAILDTGVDLAHQHFSGRIVSEACFSTNDPGSSTSSLCPGGATSSTEPGSGDDCSSEVAGCGHGTMVAGIAAGKGPSFGGVAPEADIISVKVFSRVDDASVCDGWSSCVRATLTDILAALNHVAELNETYRVTAVNMSLGSGRYTSPCDHYSPSIKSAIDNLRSLGIASVIASGNAGYTDAIAAPACISTAISVGSSTKTDDVSSFSNLAEMVDLLAPGEDIEAASMGGGTQTASGTSLSAPHVAGAWASLRSAVPGTGVADVLEALSETGVLISDHRGSPPSGTVVPRMQLDEALDFLLESAPVAPPEMTPPGGSFMQPVEVTIMTGTPDALVRYTMDGSEPTPSWGQLLHSGESVMIERSTELKAVAYTEDQVVSEVSSDIYRIRSSLKVDIEPPEAVGDGARWRLQGVSVEGFESADLDRYDWQTHGDGSWTVLSAGRPGIYIAGSPALQDDESASLELCIESDGGDIAFSAYVSSEEGYDELCFFIDDVEQGCWSGETDWMDLSFPVDPGTRTFRWTYEKDHSVSEGLDAAFLNEVHFPGDQWRSPGETLSWLPAKEDQALTSVSFNGLSLWEAPGAFHLSLPAGESKTVTGVYSPRQVSTPTFSPDPTVPYDSDIEVSISTNTSGSEVRYTTDGSVPDEDAELYDEPIVLSDHGEITIKARAYKEGWLPSEPASATYLLGDVLEAPSISPASGVYFEPVEVEIIAEAPGVKIHYTVDGGEPNEHSAIYDAPFEIPNDSSLTVSARAYKDGWIPSFVAQVSILVTGIVAEPFFSIEPGSYTSPQTVEISTSTPNAIVRYTTDGSEPDRRSPDYRLPIVIEEESEKTIKAKAFRRDWQESNTVTGVFTVTGNAITPIFEPDAREDYVDELLVTITSKTPGSTIRFTTDGSEPAADSEIHDEPIVMEPGSVMEICARAYADDWKPSEPACASYGVLPRADPPVISPQGGMHHEDVSVTLSHDNPDAVIHFTLDGGNPNESSSVYEGPLDLPWNESTEVRAVAKADGWSRSTVSSATYHLYPQLWVLGEGGEYSVVIIPDEQEHEEKQEIAPPQTTLGCGCETAGTGGLPGSATAVLMLYLLLLRRLGTPSRTT